MGQCESPGEMGHPPVLCCRVLSCPAGWCWPVAEGCLPLAVSRSLGSSISCRFREQNVPGAKRGKPVISEEPARNASNESTGKCWRDRGCPALATLSRCPLKAAELSRRGCGGAGSLEVMAAAREDCDSVPVLLPDVAQAGLVPQSELRHTDHKH